MSVQLEEISRKVGREHENGTLGNVQGNNLGKQIEKLNRIIAGGGILGNCLIYQLPFLSHSPLYSYQQKKKPSMDPGKTLTTLGFLDMIYWSLDRFYYPRTGFISCQQHYKFFPPPTPPSPIWPGCAVYPRRSRGAGRRSRRCIAKE
ncbi:hypothetical protein Cdeb_03199 [Caldibacillus debilis GB1]|uniref:Uncharacterized protein n=1 Tax=Caldibacillus debilis GB1 TaxID=1339248 RepID=A0A420VG81_9BACI|nr:hypothetical protein Cdeb_03199 [Caldibacillus debilis GB1]